MIQLQFSGVNKLWEELDNKVAGITEIISSNSKNQIAKAAFTITTKRFLSDFSVEAAQNPKKYHHMYEWNKIGNNNQKLFKVKRGNLGAGDLSITFNFGKSNTSVPIPAALRVPGRSGRSVKKRSIFQNKADVMESGRPVTFTTRQYIAFLSGNDDKIHFLPPRTLVQILNPGGRLTTGSFDKYVVRWYSKRVDQTLRSSGLFDNIGKAVAKTLNQKGTGKSQARESIRLVTEKYAQCKVEF